MDISVVIPLYNEDESIGELFGWIKRVMEAHGFSYEVIFVNDGSTDRSWQVIEQLHAAEPDMCTASSSGATMARALLSIAALSRPEAMW